MSEHEKPRELELSWDGYAYRVSIPNYLRSGERVRLVKAEPVEHEREELLDLISAYYNHVEGPGCCAELDERAYAILFKYGWLEETHKPPVERSGQLVIDTTLSNEERREWNTRLEDPETWLGLRRLADRMLASEIKELDTALEDLRKGILKLGYTVGRNPDGVDDTITATLLIVKELQKNLQDKTIWYEDRNKLLDLFCELKTDDWRENEFFHFLEKPWQYKQED